MGVAGPAEDLIERSRDYGLRNRPDRCRKGPRLGLASARTNHGENEMAEYP